MSSSSTTASLLFAAACLGAGYAIGSSSATRSLAKEAKEEVKEEDTHAHTSEGVVGHLHWDENQERRGLGTALVKLVRAAPAVAEARCGPAACTTTLRLRGLG